MKQLYRFAIATCGFLTTEDDMTGFGGVLLLIAGVAIGDGNQQSKRQALACIVSLLKDMRNGSEEACEAMESLLTEAIKAHLDAVRAA